MKYSRKIKKLSKKQMSLDTSDAPSPRKPLGPQHPQPLGVEMWGQLPWFPSSQCHQNLDSLRTDAKQKYGDTVWRK